MVVATKIVVVDNQIEPALKALKKQMQKDGLFQEMKRRVAYDKPSVKRKRKQAAARKKRRKAMRRGERDGEEHVDEGHSHGRLWPSDAPGPPRAARPRPGRPGGEGLQPRVSRLRRCGVRRRDLSR